MLNHPVTSSSHWRIPARHGGPLPTRGAWRVARGWLGVGTWRAARWLWRTLVMGLLVGSVLGPPLLVVGALVCLFAPSLTVGRHLAPALIVAALLWLLAAIFGAHAHARPRSDDDDPTSALP